MLSRRDQGGLPGTWRGTPETEGGNGSMAGGYRSAYVPNATAGTAPGQWSPTVANLVVLLVMEIAGYALLRWFFRTAHGG